MALLPGAPPADSQRDVTIHLLPDRADVYCRLADPGLCIGQAGEKGASEEALRPLPWIVLAWVNPDHCHWRSTRTHAHGYDAHAGPMGRPIGPVSGPSLHGGDADSEVVLPGAGEFHLHDMRVLEAAPGEWLEPLVAVYDGVTGRYVRGLGLHFRTAVLTGGRVLEVVGEHDDPAVQYRVGVPGPLGRIVRDALLPPSDFVNYRVGDWVFVLESGCDQPPLPLMDVRGEGAVAGAVIYPDISGVIVPLRCGIFQAVSAACQPLDLPRVSEHPTGDLLDFCLREGTVIQVNPGGTLDVEMPWGRETVPAHYHCPKATSVAGGHTAFQPEDEVLVVSTREQRRAHAVIGFADRTPRPCKEYLLIGTGFPSLSGRQFYIVWDPQLGALAEDIPDGKGGLISPSEYPCTVDKLNFWIFTSRLIDPYDEMPSNIISAARIGHMDEVASREDTGPSFNRFGADLSCELPGECPEFPLIDLGSGGVVGGRSGACSQVIRQPNAHQGEDVASYEISVECMTLSDDHDAIFQQEHWRSEIPFLQCYPGASPPHPAYSMICTWEGKAEGAPSWQDVTQVSRTYTAEKHLRYATDGSFNEMRIQESVADKVSFPGIPHRAELAWVDTTIAVRPVVGDGHRDWTWNDRYVTVQSFGIRTRRSWLFAHVVFTARWYVTPYAQVDPDRKKIYGRDVVVAAGAGLTSEVGLEANPFRLPTDANLEDALSALLWSAVLDANFSTTLAQNLFSVEVRA